MEILASEIGSKLKFSLLENDQNQENFVDMLNEISKSNFSPMTFLLCISIYDSNNQNLISVMYFGSLFNASYAGTSSYFKRGIFGANSGRVFTILQKIAPR